MRQLALGMAMVATAAVLLGAAARADDLAETVLARVQPCWAPPPAPADGHAAVVVLRVKLSPKGDLIGLPTESEPDRLRSPYDQALAASARRAVVQCQPYDLPAERYEEWKDLTLRFIPSPPMGSR